jgi:small subunit ribosomal protein S2
MPLPNSKELLDCGVHFGHLRKKWNPKMAPYVFMEKKGIHIIDLNKTIEQMEKAGQALRAIARSGKKILFVATKKQGKDLVKKAAESVGMPFVTDRWLGGMMTNFSTVRKSVKKMQNIERILEDNSLTSVTKKERLMLNREREKMDKAIGGIANLNRLPSAMFIVDILHEHIALAEAHNLGIRTFAMVDTNSDPNEVDFAIPANDDAAKSIGIITNYMVECIKEGLAERGSSNEKEDDGNANAEKSEKKDTGDKRPPMRKRKKEEN